MYSFQIENIPGNKRETIPKKCDNSSPSFSELMSKHACLSFNMYLPTYLLHILEDGAAFPGLFDHSSITTESAPTTPVVSTISKGGCFQKGHYYADGASIESEDPCEHCYCMKGDIICAVEPCMDAMEADAESCLPQPAPPGECCPKEYKCGKSE